MNITLLAKKGGVGKSTVSILLYEAFRQAGKSVSIHDWDAQGTSSKSLELIHGAKRQDRTENTSIVIYDTPPSLEHTATATAVRSADIVLVVTSPSPADIWEADDAVRFVQAKNPKAYVRVLFNKVRRSTVHLVGDGIHRRLVWRLAHTRLVFAAVQRSLCQTVRRVRPDG
jgi:MinD-like ATPase involved in chromosome partitioning or flagellar assembly